MIEPTAFRTISYGLYLISAQAEGKAAGCTVNTFAQVTSDPRQVTVTMNKENHTTSVVKQAGRYTAISLSEQASMDLIGTFGFYCSRDIDKFEPYAVDTDAAGTPYVTEMAAARFTVEVTDSLDLGTHILFVGTVVETKMLSDEKPMTYAHYHEVKGGKTPPRASSYIAEPNDAPSAKATEDNTGSETNNSAAKYAWRCTICGHVECVDELPDDFTCPICGMGKEFFERIEL